jgi:sarcosine oxidase, subunit gamma
MSEVLEPSQQSASNRADITPAHGCALMNQRPANMSQAESPLHRFRWQNVSQGSGGVVLRELALMGHLVLRGNAANPDFVTAGADVVGVALPTTLNSSALGNLVVRWLAPDEWLITLPGEQAWAMEKALRTGLSGHYSVVNVSGGQTLLNLSGPNAIEVLMKSTHYDLHDRHFGIGKVVSTTFAKSQCVLRRVAAQEWELVIRRSFADYLAAWIQDAAGEFGLVVKVS